MSLPKDIHNYLIHPFIPCIILLMMLVFTIIKLINKVEKISIVNVSITSTSFIIMLIFFGVYPSFIDGKISGFFAISYFVCFYLLFAYLIYFLIYYLVINTILINQSDYFLNAINAGPWNTYLVLDKNDRVKRISFTLIREFGLISNMEVKNKKLFDFLFQKIRVFQLNGKPIENKEFYEKYLEFKLKSSKNDLNKIEIGIYNTDGKEVFLHFIDQPIYTAFGYAGRCISGQVKTGFDKLETEKKFEIIKKDYDILNEKMVAFLEVVNDGLLFYDLNDKTVWVSDQVLKTFNLKDNIISLNTFYNFMHAEDYQKYTVLLSSLTPKKADYKIKYRLFENGSYNWYEEKGKKIFTENNITIISSLAKIANRHQMKSNIIELDNLKDENDMVVNLNKLINERANFQLIYFKIKNLKEINEANGRSVGNIILGQYVSKIKEAFISGDDELYRLSGSRFGLIITDSRKMEILKNGLSRNDNYLNLTSELGAVKVVADVYAGIVSSKFDGETALELMENVKRALSFAMNDKYLGHICYYGDLK